MHVSVMHHMGNAACICLFSGRQAVLDAIYGDMHVTRMHFAGTYCKKMLGESNWD